MPPLKVSGACPRCQHVVETTAPTGRATWRGPCPKDGCDGVLIARRVKVTAPASSSSTSTSSSTPVPPSGRTRRKVVDAGAYQRPEPKRTRQNRSPADVQRPAEPAARPAAADSAGGPTGTGSGAGDGAVEPATGGSAQVPREKPEPRRAAEPGGPERRRRNILGGYPHLY